MASNLFADLDLEESVSVIRTVVIWAFKITDLLYFQRLR